jgi:hypothetical protein
MISVASVFAWTKGTVLTGTDDSDLKPIEVKDTEPKKITRADEKLRKPKSWESSGRELATKVTKAKPKKDVSCSTEAPLLRSREA